MKLERLILYHPFLSRQIFWQPPFNAKFVYHLSYIIFALCTVDDREAIYDQRDPSLLWLWIILTYIYSVIKPIDRYSCRRIHFGFNCFRAQLLSGIDVTRKFMIQQHYDFAEIKLSFIVCSSLNMNWISNLSERNVYQQLVHEDTLHLF